jgi:hypothetical protein
VNEAEVLRGLTAGLQRIAWYPHWLVNWYLHRKQNLFLKQSSSSDANPLIIRYQTVKTLFLSYFGMRDKKDLHTDPVK